MSTSINTAPSPGAATVKVGKPFVVTGTVTDPDGVQDPIAIGSSATPPTTFGDLTDPQSSGFLSMAKLTIRNESLHTYYDYVYKAAENLYTAGQKVWVAHMASPTGIPYDASNPLLDVAGPFTVLA